MERIQNSKIVSEQYKTTECLQTRISIHEKYSVNKQGFGRWIFNQYEIIGGESILELGCGDGSMWKQNINDLPDDVSILLSDISSGMVDAAMKNLQNYSNISFSRLDIQKLPFPDKSFDIVIANMMLYHVPDLNRGLCEVKRILKRGGLFYCATFGEHGIMEYIQNLFFKYTGDRRENNIFTLQNGGSVLSQYFRTVERRDYPDYLEVTDIDDLIEYICSVKNMISLRELSVDVMRGVLQEQMKDGKVIIPKEYGLFIAGK